jgi:hypothetical protein
MELTRYVEELKQQLTATAELGGDDARALAGQLVPHLDGMVRLVLLDALSAAADEITTDLAPGSVAVRLRGREPEFEVVPPPSDVTSGDVTERTSSPPPAAPGREQPVDADDGEISRITLRLPEQLKAQVELAATADRLSVNAWLVRAVADAVDTRRPDPRATTSDTIGGQRLTGWAR